MAATVSLRDPGQPLVGMRRTQAELTADVRVLLAAHRPACDAAGEFGVDHDVPERIVDLRIAGVREDGVEFGAGQRVIGLFDGLAGDLRSPIDPIRRETEEVGAAEP